MSESTEPNPSGYSAAQQGSEYPLKWKPTAQKPVPVVRCVQIKKDGDRCKNWSIRGYTKCRKHAGPQYLMKDGNVQKYAESVVEAARLRLIDNTDLAVDVLEQLMQPGSSEGIRLKASTEVLDRAGIRGGFEVSVEADITSNPADLLADRLAKLAKGAAAVQQMRNSTAPANEDIVDAEVIEDDPDQETLF